MPNELLEKILLDVPERDLLTSAQRTCKRIKSLVDDSTAIQVKLFFRLPPGEKAELATFTSSGKGPTEYVLNPLLYAMNSSLENTIKKVKVEDTVMPGQEPYEDTAHNPWLELNIKDSARFHLLWSLLNTSTISRRPSWMEMFVVLPPWHGPVCTILPDNRPWVSWQVLNTCDMGVDGLKMKHIVDKDHLDIKVWNFCAQRLLGKLIIVIKA